MKRNFAIDISRLFFAIGVVILHTRPLGELAVGSVLETIFSVAVPFFLCCQVGGAKSVKTEQRGLLDL